jgi:hypothetical protein
MLKWNEPRYRPAVNRDRDVLSGRDPVEELPRAVAELT